MLFYSVLINSVPKGLKPLTFLNCWRNVPECSSYSTMH